MKETNFQAIRAVVLDAGNVLVHLGERTERIVWAERLGLSLSEFTDRIWEAIGSFGASDKPVIWKRISKAVGVPISEAEALLIDFHSHWQPDLVLLEFLTSLRPRFRTAVLANAGLAARLGFEDILNLHKRVDSVLISAELGVEKPDARAYLAALQALKVLPGECVFVDDRPENVEGARAVGMAAFQHKSTASTVEALTNALALATR